MVLFKCKMCGGTLEIDPGSTVAACEFCGTQQTLPRLDDDRRANLYDRANHFRRNNEYDKATGIYERILNDDPQDAEAYWSLVLCRYGIEYVEDPGTHRRIPTVNRAQFTSVFDDDNYKSALRYADGAQRGLYQEEARAINEIQKGILAISQKEEPFDVFICYKETDREGRRTPDSVLANELYHQLTQEGFKVFFSRITLEDKLGSAYEPYIFAALNSARVMVVLGTKPEYFSAVWVKNEWSRYLSLIRGGEKKMLIPAYKDMDPYDLPEEFSHLQAQDMSKLGFMQDLIRGIRKIVGKAPQEASTPSDPAPAAGSAGITPLIRRIFMFLEDGEFASAKEYCEKVLDMDPENSQAYLGKLMADVRARTRESLINCREPFSGNSNYLKVLRFGDEPLKQELQSCITAIEQRNERERVAGIYQKALDLMAQNQPAAYLKAAELFRTIPDHRDAEAKVTECEEKAEASRKDIIYQEAAALMRQNNVASFNSAREKLETISDWRDSAALIDRCRGSVEALITQAEQARLAEIRRAQAQQEARIRAAKEKQRKTVVTLASIAAVVVVIVLLVNVMNYFTYKPLREALQRDEIPVSEIKARYRDIQNDKGALKVFEKELERCHKDNDLEKTLEILTALAECDVWFSDWVINSEGNTSLDLSPYLAGWDTFINWMYDETVKNGTKIETVDYDVIIDHGYDLSDEVTATYEVYGYYISVDRLSSGRVYRLLLFTPSKGWFKLDSNTKYFDGGSNIAFHRQEGGVMVD